MSSGTIGAALSSSLSQVRSIAVSYGTVLHPTPKTLHAPAHRLAANICQHLWENWDQDAGGLRNGEVDLYNVNIPMIETLLSDEGLQIEWTNIWRNSYGRLFKALPRSQANLNKEGSKAGPDSPHADPAGGSVGIEEVNKDEVNQLVFKFSPDFKNLISPNPTTLPEGSDGWAIAKGVVSVTPLRASFAEPEVRPENGGDRVWKLKL
ncbi:hypothetical protein HWV62_27667 [Athelia sp. TMB]|nr:hypothetical protein HWV62_27667 [Athelia sp. TMB]